MPIVAVANQKGGVGKTTTTLNLGAALREAGKRVLLVDLDPQANLSVATGLLDAEDRFPTIGDLLLGSARGRGAAPATLENAVVSSPAGLDLLPANSSLSAADLGLVSALNRESALARVLRTAVDRYDDVLIDCLPSLGLLAINALRAADGVVIPVQADFLAMQGLGQMFETIAAVREHLHPRLAIYGVLLTMVDQRTIHARDVVATIRSSLAGQVHVFETEVRLHVALKDSAKAGRTILDFDSAGRSAQAYRSLGLELLERVEGEGPQGASASPARRHPGARAADDGWSRVVPLGGTHATRGDGGGSRHATASDAPDPGEARAAMGEVVGPDRRSLPRPLRLAEVVEGCEQWLGRSRR